MIVGVGGIPLLQSYIIHTRISHMTLIKAAASIVVALILAAIPLLFEKEVRSVIV